MACTPGTADVGDDDRRRRGRGSWRSRSANTGRSQVFHRGCREGRRSAPRHVMARPALVREAGVARRVLMEFCVGGRDGPLSSDGPRARPAGQPGGRGQARKLEREDDLGIEHRGHQSIDTLRVRCPGHCEHRAAKTASGEGVHRAFKTGEASPKEHKRMRGHGHRAGLTPPSVLRIPAWSKALRSTRRSPASSGNRRQGTAPTARRHGPPTRWFRSGRGRKPLEREAWTWQQDETSLQGRARSKPSRACETLRAEHRWAWDARRSWTRWADVAKRYETPRKAPG